MSNIVLYDFSPPGEEVAYSNEAETEAFSDGVNGKALKELESIWHKAEKLSKGWWGVYAALYRVGDGSPYCGYEQVHVCLSMDFVPAKKDLARAIVGVVDWVNNKRGSSRPEVIVDLDEGLLMLRMWVYAGKKPTEFIKAGGKRFLELLKAAGWDQ